MKKYIKASDGSFVSFAKKAKTTFNPVTAACGGKKTVNASGDATDFSAFRWDWDEWDDYGKRINPTAAMKAAVKSEAGDVAIDKVLKPTGSIGRYLKRKGIQSLIFVYDPESDFEDMYVEVFGWTGSALDDSSSYMLADIQDNAGIEGSTKAAGKFIKAASGDIEGSKKVSKGKNILAGYDEYDEDVNLPGKIRRQIAELTGWDEDDIAFAFQQWIYDGGGEYDPDEMPKAFRDDIASDVELGEDIEAKYLGD